VVPALLLEELRELKRGYKMKYFIPFLLLLAAGCNGGSGNSQGLTYDLNENGCDTGSHSFGSTADYCNGLRNNALNNGCAEGLRHETFTQSCAGTSWDTDTSSTNDGSDSSQGYDYDYSIYGCATGPQHFHHHREYCNALKDNELNNGCAREARHDQFQQDCSAYSWD
jgi:hypothetical protein